jgi:hypothetical protein
VIEFIFMLTRDDVTLANARAVYASVAMGFAPIGNMIAGATIDLFGITATLAGIMALLAVYVLILSAVPVFRQMERITPKPQVLAE